jgi:hypothetical protein
MWRLKCQLLNWQSHEIFDPRFFFYQTIPPRALIHALKPFRIWLRIHRENSIIHRWNDFSGVIDTAETISAVLLTPLKPILATFEAIISANTMPYLKRF